MTVHEHPRSACSSVPRSGGEHPDVPYPPLAGELVDLAKALKESYTYLVSHGVDKTSAQDLAAEAVWRLWCRLRSGQQLDRPFAYLIRITHNLRCDQERKSAHERAVFAELSALADRGDSSEDQQYGEVVAGVAIKQAAMGLSPRYQQALFCLGELDMSNAQIAECLGLASAGAAAVLVHRARLALRAELAATGVVALGRSPR
jgi:DNA-directed RNA polymerase specialized sigma24 family protein